MEFGSLFDYLKKNSDLTLQDKMKMAIDIAQGMRCLEQHKHVHRVRRTQSTAPLTLYRI